MHEILAPLNKNQRQAAQCTKGPVLILAGAGSGKTKTLVHRLAYLIEKERVKPQNILAVTFTNKAAQEMKGRIKSLLGKNRKIFPIMGTFHSICVQILRREIEIIDYKKNFVIFDDQDSQRLIKKIIKDTGYDKDNISPRAISTLISRAKNQLQDSGEYESQANEMIENITSKVYHKYQAELKLHNALDFDDLIMMVVEIFEQYPEILKKYQTIFKHILVDEYQDTNHAQYALVNMLAKDNKNICVVGDDFQSIYSWRGANMQNILNFETDYPEARVILLEQNYRSTKNIINASNEIIKYNINQKEKKLWTDNPHGSKIIIKEVADEKSEGEYIIKQIFDIEDDNVKANDPEEITYEPEDSILDKIMKSPTFAENKEDKNILEIVKKKKKIIDFSKYVILYRTNAQSRAIEESFLKYNVPYRIIGGIKFYERKEIKDIICYLRTIVNPDDFVSIDRIINTPARSIGKITWQKIESEIRNTGTNILTIAEDQLPQLQNKGHLAFLNFQKSIQEISKKMQKLNPTEIIDLITTKTGYKDFILDGTEEGENRWANIQEIKTVTKKYDHQKGADGINAFLEEITLVSDQDDIDEKAKAVNMMTVHAAKGLEFPIIFVVGMEEGLFPHNRSLFDPEEMEEERRLCYVALTRAKEKAYLIYSTQRQIFGSLQANSPSRFIDDIPENLVARS